MDFVEDHQPIEVVGEVELGLGELGAVGLGLEVEVERASPNAAAAFSASVVFPTWRGPSSATAGE